MTTQGELATQGGFLEEVPANLSNNNCCGVQNIPAMTTTTALSMFTYFIFTVI